MCGISGIYRKNSKPYLESIAKQMSDSIVHRGPNDSGSWSSSDICFTHRRLNIIDAAGGKQPFVDDNNEVVINFNGEIYNYLELKAELCEYSFKTESDTEVILAAYKTWGLKFTDKLCGMFAIAIYDSRINHIFLIRDRLGIKPLFYFYENSTFAFSSEINSLKLALENKSLDHDAIHLFLRYSYIPDTHCLYTKIRKLNAATILSFNLATEKVSFKCYWTPQPQFILNDYNQAQEMWHELLSLVIQQHLRSDVPVGTFLSGGLDSSLVTALAAQACKKTITSFAIDFDETDFSESVYFNHAAKTLGIKLISKKIDGHSALSCLQKDQDYFGEPFGDNSYIATNEICNVSSQNFKVVLSGDGADEIFSGYKSYLKTYEQFNNKIKASDMLIYHNSQREIFNSDELKKLVLNYTETPSLYSEPKSHIDPVLHFQLEDIKNYLTGDILTKIDRMSMRHSLEVRVPFLDHRIVEFALNLPLDWKIKKNVQQLVPKYFLRNYAERFFSRDYLNRPKQGFGVPLKLWLFQFKADIENTLTNKNSALYDFIDFSFAQLLLNRFFSREKILPEKIWNLCILSHFLSKPH